MKGVMTLASQKVEEYTKEGVRWKADGWQRNEYEANGHYQEFSHESKGWSSGRNQSSSSAHFGSASSGSWDEWDNNSNRKQETKGAASSNGDGWAGWDDAKDDGFDNYCQSTSDRKDISGHNGKSDAKWTEGGFL